MELTKNELEKFNGKEGNRTYVAANGKVYDISDSKLWKNGKHMNRHEAGRDLSNDFSAAPHGTEVLEKYKQIGTLKEVGEETPKLPIPNWIASILEKFPFLKRHPHPMVVHFTMTYFITSSVLLLWYYVMNPAKPLLDAIFYMHILATISLPFAIFSGWLSWKVNYLGKSINYIIFKIILTTVAFVFNTIVLICLIYQPDILIAPQGTELIIPILIFSYLPIASLIGFFGGQLVY